MNDHSEDKGRILVVEDSPVLSLRAEDILTDRGFFIVGPAYDMMQAIDLAKREQIDAAVIDLNIRGEKSFDVMKTLEERGVPFVITSGYADWSMPEEWRERPRLQKPFEDDALAGAVRDLLRSEDD
ncbi:response regulator [Sphingomicrobium nitratireducens]|uniref:response regulator n=1 Tax=Sphingomicrobium nitratireducens TaxID=2964666 RepID=UPI0022400337|nr:response regulator [Sphingomicrobium nitratireducens]